MPDHTLDNFEIRNKEIEDQLKKIGAMLNAVCPRGYVFTYLLSTVGEGGATFYISNGNREDIINVMCEFLDKISEK